MDNNRPMLSKDLDHNLFLQYYYLKEELVEFCRKYELSTVGGKKDLTKKISHFLKTGEKKTSEITRNNNSKLINYELSLDSIIEDNFVCSEKHRGFFKSVIGKNFSFNVEFQKYLKNNAGKTYLDAVNEWYKICENKKKNKGISNIDSQFEYNTYIRDFFKENKDKTLNDAIKCWKYKRGLPGHNKYENLDLHILNS